MFNKILKAILDVVLYIPQDQRSVVAHVLQVSNACPELVYLGDPYRPEHKAWIVGDFQISYRFANKAVHLGDVSYPLCWRARRILTRNFNHIFLMQHHQKVGKKIAGIVASNQEAAKERTVEKPQSKSRTAIPLMPETKPTGGLSNFVGKKVRIKTTAKGCFEGTVHHLGFFYGSGVYKIGEHEPAWFYDGVCQNKGLDYYIHSVYEMLPKSDSLSPSLEDLSYYFGSIVKITMKDGNVYQGEVGVDCRGKYGLIGMTERLYLEDIVAVEYFTEKEPEWLTTFNLLEWDGKTIDVLRRDGIEIKNVPVRIKNRLNDYAVYLEDELFTLRGRSLKHFEKPEDVVAIKPSSP